MDFLYLDFKKLPIIFITINTTKVCQTAIVILAVKICITMLNKNVINSSTKYIINPNNGKANNGWILVAFIFHPNRLNVIFIICIINK